MKNLSGVFLLVLGMVLLSGHEAGAYSRLQAAKDFPKPQFEEIFKNLWFYDTLYSIDNPELELQLRPNSITFKGTMPKKCDLLQNLDTRVVYRCRHGNMSYGDYDTYHMFVAAGPDEAGRCLVLGDTKVRPDKLNPGENPVVYYFKAEDCGEYEDLTDYLIRF